MSIISLLINETTGNIGSIFIEPQSNSPMILHIVAGVFLFVFFAGLLFLSFGKERVSFSKESVIALVSITSFVASIFLLFALAGPVEIHMKNNMRDVVSDTVSSRYDVTVNNLRRIDMPQKNAKISEAKIKFLPKNEHLLRDGLLTFEKVSEHKFRVILSVKNDTAKGKRNYIEYNH